MADARISGIVWLRYFGSKLLNRYPARSQSIFQNQRVYVRAGTSWVESLTVGVSFIDGFHVPVQILRDSGCSLLQLF
jgi:hypothetical protein